MALDDYDSMWIAYMCVVRVTGSHKPGDPTKPLTYYGVNTPQQCFSIGQLIVGSTEIGVPHFFYLINPQSLAAMSPAWTLQQLADTIQTNAVPAQTIASVAPNFPKSKMISLAHTKLAQAAHLLSLASGAAPPAKQKNAPAAKPARKTGKKK